jgi:hypothetical protein
MLGKAQEEIRIYTDKGNYKLERVKLPLEGMPSPVMVTCRI